MNYIKFGEKTISAIRQEPARTRSYESSEPKNASHRVVGLPPRAVRALREHRKRQIEEKLRASFMWQDNGLVLTNSKGTPLEAQNAVNRSFKPLLQQAGLRDIRWHDLRHTCATLLLGRDGVHPKLVQHLLGHASITMTLDRYSHWISGMGRHAANGIAEALE
jgi:integrase